MLRHNKQYHASLFSCRSESRASFVSTTAHVVSRYTTRKQRMETKESHGKYDENVGLHCQIGIFKVSTPCTQMITQKIVG